MSNDSKRNGAITGEAGGPIQDKLRKDLQTESPKFSLLHSTQQASAQTSRNINDMVRSLLAGRIEHELRPYAQLLLAELSEHLTGREAEVLKQSLMQVRLRPLGSNIQGVVTNLLSECFDELNQGASHKIALAKVRVSNVARASNKQKKVGQAEPDFSRSPSNPQARILSILRDLAIKLATFLDRSESDGISEMYELLTECQSEFKDRAGAVHLTALQQKSTDLFLLKVACAIFFEKLELILLDYLASGTDYTLVSGKVWASRYNRADYIPFLYDPISDLKKSRPWLFEDEQTISRIAAAQVQIKAADIKSARQLDYLQGNKARTLESILLEMRALFGIGLNCLVRQQGEMALRIFERVLTYSADALEHPEQKSAALTQRLSRVRVQANFSCARAEILDAATLYKKLTGKDSAQKAATLFAKKSVQIRKAIARAKNELELLGSTGFPIDIDGNCHSGLDGLSEWVQKIVQEKEAKFIYELGLTLNLYQQAHNSLCNYMTIILGFEAWESQKFLELAGKLKISSRNGSESQAFFFSQELAAHSTQLIGEVVERYLELSNDEQRNLVSCLPLMIGLCLEFENFDLGFSLAVSHRQLFKKILAVSSSNPDFELLFGIIDAEIRFRFGLYKGESKRPQESALSVLQYNRQKEAQGFFREIDRNRESRLAQAVDNLSRTQALHDLNAYRTMRLIKEGIHAQFVSQEIRMMHASARITMRRSFLKEIVNLVSSRIEKRLKIGKEDLEQCKIMNQSGQNSEILNDPQKYLSCLNTESCAVTALQMLLDVALTCANLQDEKQARSVLRHALDKYGEIFPSLNNLINSIFEAHSQEEFRRRVEGAISLMEEEARGGEISLTATNSGAALGFLLANNSVSFLTTLFDRFVVMASIARRRVLPGRCRPLQRYAIAYSWSELQYLVVSSVIALNQGLEEDGLDLLLRAS